MNFIKTHLFLLLCGVLILVGIGLFVVGHLFASANDEKLQEVTSQVQKVQQLRSRVVNLGELQQLNTDAQKAKQLQQEVERQVRQTSFRPLLSDEIFPALKSAANKDLYYSAFARNYCQSVNDLLVLLHAGTPPSQEEIERRAESLVGSGATQPGAAAGGMGFDPGMMAPDFGMPGATGTGRRGDLSNQKARLIETLDRSRAETIGLYATPDSFALYSHWKGMPSGTVDDLARDSWFTQIAAWIQQDVALAIQQLNADSTNVFHSPVKRVIGISFAGNPPVSQPTETEFTQPLSGRGGVSGSRTANPATRQPANGALLLPIYVTDSGQDARSATLATSQNKSKFKGTLVEPYTGRITNDIIDVVHFKLSVVIDAAYADHFKHALQSKKGQGDSERNQITVLAFDLQPIDLAAENASGYQYGEGNFAVARIYCEYFFFHEGYAHLMPKQVQDILSPPEKTTPGMGMPGMVPGGAMPGGASPFGP